mmetsp:Transcript_77682/g.227797  ORF Transcript_77682/g.227797 Transcript_77682/m.227797 type:complete len:264 (-) Transcript_77682:80-871(-)
MGRQARHARPMPKAATKDAKDQDESEEKVETLSYIPSDPEDPRLQLSGAVCTEDGKLDVPAYMDLQEAYKGEPAPSEHPDPARPGVRENEVVPKGLRNWDDVAAGCQGKDGAGWIAMYSSKLSGKTEKWFNIRTCGSWRLAFVLARLQRGLWEQRGAATLSRSGEAAAAEPTTPQKRKAATGTGPETARKQRKRPEGAELSGNSASAGVASESGKACDAPVPAAGPSKLDLIKARMLAKIAAKEAGQAAAGPAAEGASAKAAE